MSAHQNSATDRCTSGGAFLLTFWCYKRLPMLTSDKWRGYVAESLNSACEQHQFQLVAFVFMPEQVQLIVDPDTDEPDLDGFLSKVKHPVTERVNRDLRQYYSPLSAKLTVVESPRRKWFHFWDDGAAKQKKLERDGVSATAIEDIHQAPVKRRLCEDASLWKWSSAGWYESGRQKVDADLPQLHGLRPD